MRIGQRLAAVMDGEVIAIPVEGLTITFTAAEDLEGRAEITGLTSSEEAPDLAVILDTGALPAPLTLIKEQMAEETDE